MIKPIWRKAVLTFFILMMGLAPFAARAETFPDKPTQGTFYVDKADLISPEDRTAINKMAADLWRDKQIPLVVVTIDTLSTYQASGLGIEGYARALFNHWGLGSQSRNYGILLLVSAGDRSARIQLGGSFAHEHDAQTDDVMQSLIIPAFKQGNYSTGIKDGVKGLDSIARGLPLPTPSVPTAMLVLMIGGGLLLVFLIINLFRTGRTGWAWALIAAIGALIFFAMRNSGNGSSGGFGGGSSDGGGGSTGSW